MGAIAFSAPRVLVDGDTVEGFKSGVELVDEWVRERALGARKAGTAVVYVSFSDQDGRLAGFYTLSAQSVTRGNLRGWIARNAPEQIPVILLGMMGVDVRYQGQGLGRNLLLDAVKRAQSISEAIGARAIIVDPADETARAFYANCGFRDIPGSDRMFAKLS